MTYNKIMKKEDEEILKKLGFIKKENGKYIHKYIPKNKEFDFSAVKIPEGAVAEMFLQGLKFGKEEKTVEFKKVLEIF
ncbi:MAG: hypothetical protein ACOCRX_09775 [Candidatus Woesearchaeota archaeon]